MRREKVIAELQISAVRTYTTPTASNPNLPEALTRAILAAVSDGPENSIFSKDASSMQSSTPASH
jgi:hypothetical protein